MFVPHANDREQRSQLATSVQVSPDLTSSDSCTWLKWAVHKIFPNNTYVNAAVTFVCQVAAQVQAIVNDALDSLTEFLEDAKETTRPFWSCFISIPSEDDKHFRIEDIQRMAKKSIGLRHHSSNEAAWHEFAKGMRDGCSFNLTFQRGELDLGRDPPFHTLPAELMSSSLSKEDKRKRLAAYEKAVDGHIMESLIMDLPLRIELGKTTVGDIINGFHNTAFTIVDYGFMHFFPTDFSQYRGLGRFPKFSVRNNRVKHLIIDYLSDSNIEHVNMRQVLKTKKQVDRLFNQIIQSIRFEILGKIRSDDFERNFNDRVY